MKEEILKIQYISIFPYQDLTQSFKNLYENILEVKRVSNVFTDTFYEIVDTKFNRKLFDKIGVNPSRLIGKRIDGEKCVVMKEYSNNLSALELLKKEK